MASNEAVLAGDVEGLAPCGGIRAPIQSLNLPADLVAMVQAYMASSLSTIYRAQRS